MDTYKAIISASLNSFLTEPSNFEKRKTLIDHLKVVEGCANTSQISNTVNSARKAIVQYPSSFKTTKQQIQHDQQVSSAFSKLRRTFENNKKLRDQFCTYQTYLTYRDQFLSAVAKLPEELPLRSYKDSGELCSLDLHRYYPDHQ